MYRTDLKSYVAGETKPREMVLDALEKFFCRGLLPQLARRQCTSQHCEIRDTVGIDSLRFDLSVEFFESEALGEGIILTQAQGFRGGQHGEGFFLSSPK